MQDKGVVVQGKDVEAKVVVVLVKVAVDKDNAEQAVNVRDHLEFQSCLLKANFQIPMPTSLTELQSRFVI